MFALILGPAVLRAWDFSRPLLPVTVVGACLLTRRVEDRTPVWWPMRTRNRRTAAIWPGCIHGDLGPAPARDLLSLARRPVDTSEVTVLADPTAPQRAARPWPARAWARPVWAHLAALALVLLALLALVGTSASFSADEGAAIVQARSLADGGGWLVEHPAPEADPAGVNYPLELSERGDRGWAPYAKHPLYPLLLAGADRLGGTGAMVLLSLAGTVAAAGLAAALARRLDPSLVRVAVWTVGLASPLLFDGYLLIAHSLGAALAAAGVLAAVVAIERRRPARSLLVVPPLAACVLLRSEGLFIAGALAAIAGVIALRRAELRWSAAATAVGAALAGTGAFLLDRAWTARLVGPSQGVAGGASVPGGGTGLVAGRVKGFILTWLTPSYSGRPVLGLLLLAMLVAITVAALTARRRPGDAGRIVGCAVVAAGAAVAALLVAPGTVVPGLFLAFPVGSAGLLLVGRRTLRTDAARIAAGVSVLFVLAVAATQYTKGGGGEWGGRYFALVLPIAVPVLLVALRDAGGALAPAVARWAGVALVVCSLALTTMGVTALGTSHRANARLVDAVDHAGRTVAVDRPVMVTTEGAMPRFAWPTFARQRWLLAGPDGLGDLLDRLSETGVTRVGFVTRNFDRDRAVIKAAGVRVVSADDSQGERRWHILVLDLD